MTSKLTLKDYLLVSSEEETSDDDIEEVFIKTKQKLEEQNPPTKVVLVEEFVRSDPIPIPLKRHKNFTNLPIKNLEIAQNIKVLSDKKIVKEELKK